MDNTLHQLKARVASLESKIDMLESELMYLNDMLVRCGFPEGITTLKETVHELLAEDASQYKNHERPELI
jgi:prefoldin subunit 5